jgi:membrane protease YdiL (CAAX protease family)
VNQVIGWSLIGLFLISWVVCSALIKRRAGTSPFVIYAGGFVGGCIVIAAVAALMLPNVAKQEVSKSNPTPPPLAPTTSKTVLLYFLPKGQTSLPNA